MKTHDRALVTRNPDSANPAYSIITQMEYHPPTAKELLSARTCSVLGTSITTTTLAFAVLSIGGTATDIGVVIAVQQVALAVAMLFGGVLADRYPRHRVMVTADLLAGLAQTLIAVVMLTGIATPGHLAALAILSGAGAGLFFPAAQGSIPQTVPRSSVQTANAVLRFSTNLFTILGAALGGLLVIAVGPGWAMAVDGVTFLISAALISRLALPPADRDQNESVLASAKQGWYAVARRPWVWHGMVLYGVVALAYLPGLRVFGPLAAETELGGAGAWAAIMVGNSCGLVVGSLLAMRWKPRRPIAIGMAATALMAPQFLFLAIGAGTAATASVALLSGISVSLMGVYWNTALHHRIPDNEQSRVSAFNQLANMSAGPLGLAIAGPVIGMIGLRSSLWIVVALIVIPSLVGAFLPSIRNVTNEPEHKHVPGDAPTESTDIGSTSK